MVMIACIGIILTSDAPAYADGTAAQDDFEHLMSHRVNIKCSDDEALRVVLT